MEDRDRIPSPDLAAPDDADDSQPSIPGLPEEADEIIELVEDAERAVAAAPPAEVDLEQATREIQALRSKLDRKDKQIEQVMEAYRAKKAESESLRKRIEKTERRRFEQSKGDFIARFVEVLDNLDRAIDSIENAFDPDAVLEGIMLVRSRLVQLLREEGLEKIFVRGQAFDPTHSEAALIEEVPDEELDGCVVRELQPGYMLKGSLLRAARVVVGRYGAEGGAASEPAPSPEHVSEPEPANELDANSWETDDTPHELEFGEDGLDFSKDG